MQQLGTQQLDAPAALVRAVEAGADFGLEILIPRGEQVSDGAAALRQKPRREGQGGAVSGYPSVEE